MFFFFFQAEDGIRDHAQSRGLGDVYKRQEYIFSSLIFPFASQLIVNLKINLCSSQVYDSIICPKESYFVIALGELKSFPKNSLLSIKILLLLQILMVFLPSVLSGQLLSLIHI
eukprot:TRINITY_DN25965_c0_g1_i1.p1 TRINITY_DN25965_c0_g1~~TRINITY_DN25965_c0_g1_i1.p1  ORF type:complete len:114 (+),score=13.57 TRINITY_DN25965_c0_g1_i1:43-384(+)